LDEQALEIRCLGSDVVVEEIHGKARSRSYQHGEQTFDVERLKIGEQLGAKMFGSGEDPTSRKEPGIAPVGRGGYCVQSREYLCFRTGGQCPGCHELLQAANLETDLIDAFGDD
jgi:hypothetical protein